MSRVQLHCGHVLDVLQRLPDESVRCVVTSPPYWGLRDYGLPVTAFGGEPECVHQWGDDIRRGGSAGAQGSTSQRNGRRNVKQQERQDDSLGAFCLHCGAWRGQLGLEPTPELYIAHMVEIFREVRRVLTKDGTLWLNMGDCYATGAGRVGEQGARWKGDVNRLRDAKRGYRGDRIAGTNSGGTKGSKAMGPMTQPNRMPLPGLKPKDLVMMPARLVLALQAGFSRCTGCYLEQGSTAWPVLQGHRVCVACLVAGRRDAKVVQTEPGWFVRMDIVWSKTNPMPESVRDRPTRSHEYLFLLSKAKRYYYDPDAIAEPLTTDPRENYPARAKVTGRGTQPGAAVRGNDRDKSGGFPPKKKPVAGWATGMPDHTAIGHARKRSGNKGRKFGDAVGCTGSHLGRSIPWEDDGGGRNARSVWTIATQPYKGAHFATFPQDLARRCILAGSRRGDTILDPFGGAGTVALVASNLGRHSIYIDLKPEYVAMATRRIGPMLCG